MLWDKLRCRGLAAALIGLTFTAPGWAAPVTLDFSVVLDTSGPKPPGVSSGDLLTGSIVFDLDEIAAQFNDADDGSYSFNPGTSSLSFSVGGFSRTAELHGIVLSNSFNDTIEFDARLPGQEEWYVRLVDTAATAWNTTFLENIPISTLTNAAIFTNSPNDIRRFVYGDFNPGGFRLGGDLTSLQGDDVQPIPLPPSVVLFLSGLISLWLLRRRQKPVVVAA